MFDEARRKRRLNLLNIKQIYLICTKRTKERILAKFEPIVEEYNKVVDEIAALNDEYEYEFYRFVGPYDKENFEKDKEVRAEIKIISALINIPIM